MISIIKSYIPRGCSNDENGDEGDQGTPGHRELIEAKLRELPSLREETRRLQRLLIGNAVDLELDGNGRFLIPPRLREYAKLDKRAMLVGQLNKFQLWDEDAWNAMAEADLAAIKQPGGLPDELRDLIL